MKDTKSINLDQKVVLITGGTGSFGQKIAYYLLNNFNLKKLIIFSRDEQKQVEMQHSAAFHNKKNLRFFIGDVRDKNRLKMAMRDVEYVIHTAALKHVPVAEYNPFECIHTNVLGAENIVNSAVDSCVKHVVALSTDKAVNPINIYGASKLAADKIFVAANAYTADTGVCFSVVRYGNVIGSRGSIIPLFRKLLNEGADSLPITDERMTRFWITMEQGIKCVLSSLFMHQGGEIFVPKVPSMKIVDLVEALAPNISTHVIGIRPGEKLHEVLIGGDDTAEVIDIGDRYVICPQHNDKVARYYLDNGGRKIGYGFKYSSDNNNDWMGKEQFSKLMENL